MVVVTAATSSKGGTSGGAKRRVTSSRTIIMINQVDRYRHGGATMIFEARAAEPPNDLEIRGAKLAAANTNSALLLSLWPLASGECVARVHFSPDF